MIELSILMHMVLSYRKCKEVQGKMHAKDLLFSCPASLVYLLSDPCNELCKAIALFTWTLKSDELLVLKRTTMYIYQLINLKIKLYKILLKIPASIMQG